MLLVVSSEAEEHRRLIDRRVGVNVAAAREAAGFTRAQLSAETGVSLSVLIRHEEGKQEIPASLLVEIAEILGINLASLFAGTPSPSEIGRAKKTKTPE